MLLRALSASSGGTKASDQGPDKKPKGGGGSQHFLPGNTRLRFSFNLPANGARSFTGDEAITAVLEAKRTVEKGGSDSWVSVQLRGKNPCHKEWKGHVEGLRCVVDEKEIRVSVEPTLQVKWSEDDDCWEVNENVVYKKLSLFWGKISVSE